MAALIRYANETTGESDSTLSDAVESLVAGYGGGGDLSDFSVLYADGTTEQMAPLSSLFLAASMAVLGKPVHSIIANGAVLWPKIVLPGDYQEVSFVENTGGQYLELPFGFAPTDKIILIAEYVTMTDDRFLVAPKIWNDTGSNRFALAGGGIVQYGYGASGTGATHLTLRATQGIHTFGYDNYKFSYDNYSDGGDVSSIAFVGTTANLRLFFGYDSPTVGRIYRYIHRKGGTTYCLVPCYRKSDGVIGMYDITTQSFYTNQGSGTFAKGQDINF